MLEQLDEEDEVGMPSMQPPMESRCLACCMLKLPQINRIEENISVEQLEQQLHRSVSPACTRTCEQTRLVPADTLKCCRPPPQHSSVHCAEGPRNADRRSTASCGNSLGTLWVLMVLYGYSMILHGTLWVLYGYSMGTVLYGSLWLRMGLPWCISPNMVARCLLRVARCRTLGGCGRAAEENCAGETRIAGEAGRGSSEQAVQHCR